MPTFRWTQQWFSNMWKWCLLQWVNTNKNESTWVLAKCRILALKNKNPIDVKDICVRFTFLLKAVIHKYWNIGLILQIKAVGLDTSLSNLICSKGIDESDMSLSRLTCWIAGFDLVQIKFCFFGGLANCQTKCVFKWAKPPTAAGRETLHNCFTSAAKRIASCSEFLVVRELLSDLTCLGTTSHLPHFTSV